MSKQIDVVLPETKCRRVEIVMSDRELQIIDTNARKTGLNRSEYLRARGMKRTYTIARHLPDPDYAKLMSNLRELKAQGNNLNQMTRAVHLARLAGNMVIVDDRQLQATLEANNRATQAILNVMK
jgi:Bacterial mobilisation protein (MobC)